MRRALAVIACAALAGLVVAGLIQARSGGDAGERPPFSLADARRSLAGAPTPLAGLHAQSAELLDGGVIAFRRRLADLKGHPVVVNKWASWCLPCRLEFPAFQAQATKRGREIAFLGLNSGDNRADARDFLKRFPVPYPSYTDPDERIARAIGAPANYPITIFYDARGRRAFIHQGGYRTEAALARDIERYLVALGDA